MMTDESAKAKMRALCYERLGHMQMGGRQERDPAWASTIGGDGGVDMPTDGTRGGTDIWCDWSYLMCLWGSTPARDARYAGGSSVDSLYYPSSNRRPHSNHTLAGRQSPPRHVLGRRWLC